MMHNNSNTIANAAVPPSSARPFSPSNKYAVAAPLPARRRIVGNGVLAGGGFDTNLPDI